MVNSTGSVQQYRVSVFKTGGFMGDRFEVQVVEVAPGAEIPEGGELVVEASSVKPKRAAKVEAAEAPAE